MDSSLLKLPCRLERGHQVSVPSHIVYRYRYILLNKSVTKKRNGKPVFSFVSLTLVSIFWWRTGGSVGFRCYIIQHTEWYCRAVAPDSNASSPCHPPSSHVRQLRILELISRNWLRCMMFGSFGSPRRRYV